MMPRMTAALNRFGSPVQIRLVTNAVSDFETVEAETKLATIQAVLQPLTPRQLQVKSEGERALRWWTMWTTQAIEVSQYLQDQAGVRYRVMNVSNWSQAGYYQYELTEANSAQ